MRDRRGRPSGKIHQTGQTTPWIDIYLPAKKPGKRISRNHKPYFEYRKNRSDMPNRRL